MAATGLTDKQQAALTMISDVLLTLGTVTVAVSIATQAPALPLVLGILGAIGGGLARALKELSGAATSSPPAAPSSPTTSQK